MTSLSWIKGKIHQEWERSLADRFDPERVKQEADENGVVRDYENSYSMHHKTVEATPEEVKELLARYKKAEAGLIIWDEDKKMLVEFEQPADEGGGDG